MGSCHVMDPWGHWIHGILGSMDLGMLGSLDLEILGFLDLGILGSMDLGTLDPWIWGSMMRLMRIFIITGRIIACCVCLYMSFG